MPARTEARTGKIYLDMPVTYLKGVGPARAEALRRLGVITARDLLFHIPRRYEDASTISPISSLEPGMDGTIIGRVISKGIIPTRRGLRIFPAVRKDDEGVNGGRVLAVYPATEGLSFKIIRGVIDAHLETLLPLLKEYLPDDVLRLPGGAALREAVRTGTRP